MTCQKILQMTLFSLALAPSIYGLVDYSDGGSFVPKNSGARSIKNPTKKKAPRQTSTRRSPSRSGNGNSSFGNRFAAEFSYLSHDVKLGDTQGKVGMLKINAHFQTDYNIFLGAKYQQVMTSSSTLTSEGQGEQGNPELILGFNWLKIGQSNEASTVDLYGGLSFGQGNSSFATKRTDRILGITTAKRFHQFVLELGYELRMVGHGSQEELEIGNINTIQANFGWVVSGDIRFMLTAKNYRVSKGENDTHPNLLDQELKFSTISPRLMLSISPLVNIHMGAEFRTRRMKSDDVLSARLWNLDAPYGNTLSFGLSFLM